MDLNRKEVEALRTVDQEAYNKAVKNVRCLWLTGYTYKDMKSFWRSIAWLSSVKESKKATGWSAAVGDAVSRRRVKKNLQRMGWINIAKLEVIENSQKPLLQKLKKYPYPCMRRDCKVHVGESIVKALRRNPCLHGYGLSQAQQMVLVPTAAIGLLADDYETYNPPLPAMVPYVVLHKNVNPLSTDSNGYTDRDLAYFTVHSQELGEWSPAFPDTMEFNEELESFRQPPYFLSLRDKVEDAVRQQKNAE